jgi:glycosyltransferase involved in cell wall biosynthesis
MATGFAMSERSSLRLFEKIVPRSWRGAFLNRIIPMSSAKLRIYPGLEFAALYRLWRGEPSEEVLHERNAGFQRSIRDVWITQASHVIGFDTSSWILAQRCRDLERPFILDRSIGHSRAKEEGYRDLRRRYPEWAETIPAKSAASLDEEDSEHKQATHIVVPSSFVRRTLVDNGVESGKISVIPFGTDTNVFRPAETMPSGPIVFLYAGALTARKGVPDLLDAWKRAELGRRAELWLAGPGGLPSTVTLPNGTRLLGKLGRTSLADTMRRTHVFVFPSHFEGLAQVQVEALASGLPVIGTTQSGADDIVSPEETGVVLGRPEVEALTDCLRRFVDEPDLLQTMRANCIARRAQWSWNAYGDRWMDVLLRQ